MAPTAPSKRKSLRLKATERLANPLAPRKVHRPDSVVTDTFLSTKADKARIKHSSFVSRIGATSDPSTTTLSSSSASRSSSGPKSTNRITKTTLKNAKRHARRKETLKSVALDALADALPELTAEERQTGETELKGRIRHKSLGSKPGALKKKERLVRGEMERFGLSLAQLSSVRENGEDGAAAAAVPAVADTSMAGTEAQQQPHPQQSTTANRFAALRGFISATMEQNPAFSGRATGANAI
ncbi:ribosome biogenesis protein SLX9-domain-containing protein [Coniella lustricola]|uniref:Ribosome biogenesis protein SLX9 n=1 Tax=Coniella lustricola TaxID=2025994 RepID=A0A2T3AD77_9PEZI|nr:ribosome biogenesis protein SLX9-domain-containing protein [Coniella lustricola]